MSLRATVHPHESFAQFHDAASGEFFALPCPDIELAEFVKSHIGNPSFCEHRRDAFDHTRKIGVMERDDDAVFRRPHVGLRIRPEFPTEFECLERILRCKNACAAMALDYEI